MSHFSHLSNLLALGALTLCLVGNSPAQTLTADVNQLSASSGGTQTLTLDAGATHASELYFLLGSMTGTAPGQIVGAFVLPLNLDAYFMSTLVSPNAPPLQNSFGTLSPLIPGPGGTAAASFTLPAGLGPSVVGLTLQHAFVTLGVFTGAVTSVSNAVALDLVGPASAMAPIPGGSFVMGNHPGEIWWPDALPLHTVTLDSFDMDVFETTNEAYVDYLNSAYAQGSISVVNGDVVQAANGAAYCNTTSTFSSYSRIVWNGSVFTVEAGKQDQPMFEVSWYGAQAFANWRSVQDGLTPCYDLSTWSCDFSANGYRLPTEAEWEYAARGGEYSPYYKYPWGDTINGSQANYWASGDPYDGWVSPTPVGYYNGGQTPSGVDMANGYGLYDMSGNVREWCWDLYDGLYYSYSPSSNPHGPSSSTYPNRIARGGSWKDDLELRSGLRAQAWLPESRASFVGFRLVRITMK